ncbi:MAG: 2-oxoacid:ferredoxin oxidoreductase subunit beta [Candidatus Gastranaerophilales bacterium]|nr:2-oxoacid:ferredoxin oxidoreductase subunit beta [Candidatus Gastranaerophilales bacterium]
MEYTLKDYKSSTKPSWCPGCGDFAVLAALLTTMTDLQLDPDDTAIVSGIGCSSRFPFFTSTYGFHSIHGRALPVAIGLSAARPDINVITLGGDGDGFSIGGNHFIHASRKNPDITYIVMDNEIYALTKGQNSPTSHDNVITKVNPYQAVEERVNPIMMALSFETSFVARGFSGDIAQLKSIIRQAMDHKGFSFVHVLSPCVQYNDKITFDSIKEHIKPIADDHDVTDRMAGMKLVFEPGYYYTGVIYKQERPTLQEKLDEVQSKAHPGHPEGQQVEELIQQFM